MVEAGTRYEDAETVGSSLVLERIALGPSKNHSALAMNRAVAAMGTHMTATASREMMTYSAEVLRNDVPDMLEVLSESVSAPAINPWDVEEAKKMLYEQADMMKSAVDDAVISDFAHASAYQDQALSLPIVPSKEIIDSMSAEATAMFFARHYTPKNMVVAATGVSHDVVVEAADKYFGHLSGEKSKPVPAKFTGGDIRPYGYGDDGMAHVAISFESVTWSDKNLAAASVLQMIMGGGGSFSAGGPGKGMYTRLYENILNKYGFVQTSTCTQSIYSDTGLFTLYGVAAPHYGSQVVALLIEEAKKMAGPISESELSRAKNLLKSYVMMHLESRIFLQDDLARSVISYNEVLGSQTLCSQIDQVTAGDVQAVAKQLLSSPISIAAVGNISGIPQRDVVARQLTSF
uniref:Mitochondrial-processing peptidase subunit alpha n=1 Tax=Amorphochlora amoebiformis TaxID=1561963 RepID=A0A7S0H6F9_9EUKA|mmetsp:Transcript_6501/g.10008  ORF Transcript_6501/g.10008 Transcript_6501/m.10008 type:complete len:404 (+) Transcript_6501:2-1213(+)